MGLIRYAAAVGLGYALARPAARRKVRELARHPAVRRLRTRGQDAAAGGLRTATHRFGRSSAPAPSSDTTALQEGVLPPATAGATTAEDTRPGVTGLPPRHAAPPTGS